jgi:hypothetical protein
MGLILHIHSSVDASVFSHESEDVNLSTPSSKVNTTILETMKLNDDMTFKPFIKAEMSSQNSAQWSNYTLARVS